MSKFKPSFDFVCPDCDSISTCKPIGYGYYKCSACGKRNEDDLVVIYSANFHILKIKSQLKEAEKVIKVSLYIPNEDQVDIAEEEAKCYQYKYMNKSGEE